MQTQKILQALVKASPLAVLILDPSGNILMWNHSAERIFGWGADEVLGKQLPIHPEGKKDVFASLKQRVIEGESFTGVELVRQRKDGTLIDVSLSTAPLKNSAGQLVGIMVMMDDITERWQRMRELEAISTVTKALREAKTRAEMYPLILDSLLDLFHGQGAVLFLHDPRTDELVAEAALKEWAPIIGTRIPAGNLHIRDVFESGKPCLNAKIRKDPHCVFRGFSEEPESMACLPLMAHEQVVGVLSIGRRAEFSEREFRTLASIGDIAATAIHRSSLYEQKENQLQRLYALRNIDSAIIGSLDLRLTLNILLEQVITQLRVDAATILIYKSGTGLLEYGAGRGFRTSRIKETRLRVGESFAGRAVYERGMVCINDFGDPGAAPRRNRLIREEEFLSYFATPLMAKGEIKGVLEVFHRSPLRPTPDWIEFLDSLGMQAAIAVENATLFNGLQRSHDDLRMAYDTTIEGWSRALDLRDKETEGHTLRVTEKAVRLGMALGMSENEIQHLRRGALLHDIGKMGIPDHILLKPGKLTSEEWAIMKMHPVFARELLAPIDYLHPAICVPYCHHEKWDGSGYPKGLQGEDIPLPARIFAVVDVWDALTSDRPYHPAWPKDAALDHIMSQKGSHFDPEVLDTFLELGWALATGE